ncbi:MAG: hypothetical protein HUJ27_08380 [Rhodobacteraceae bacterium]|nr:hypothetical protein [Paracoccaceae bacterium]
MGRALRWYSSGFGQKDYDFSVVVTETSGVDHQGLSFRISDAKGREVLASGTSNIAHEAIAPASMDAATDSLVAASKPLAEKLRAHQLRIREAEQSAIHAELSFTPAQASVAPGESVTLTAKLTDCDGDHPPLPDREAAFDLAGSGKLDPMPGTTDSDGKITLDYTAEGADTAQISGYWAYTDTAGNQTLSDGTTATINAGGLQFSRIGISPRILPDHYAGTRPDPKFITNIWVLSDRQVDRNFPEKGMVPATATQSPFCAAQMIAPSVSVPSGDVERWAPEGVSGKQRAASEIVADLSGPEVALVHLRVSADGAPEGQWDEEDGSEVFSHVWLDLLVEIENPERKDFDLEFTPAKVRAAASGSGEYDFSLGSLGATGCKGRYRMPYSAAGQTDDMDQSVDESGRPIRLAVRDEKHLQVNLSFFGNANAWGGKMYEPFDGSSLIDVELAFRILPPEGE